MGNWENKDCVSDQGAFNVIDNRLDTSISQNYMYSMMCNNFFTVVTKKILKLGASFYIYERSEELSLRCCHITVDSTTPAP